MNFFDSQNLLWLWVLPLVALVLYYAHKRINRALFLFAKGRVFDLMQKKRSTSLVFWKALSLLLCFVFMILALARPRWGYDWKELPQGGVDIMVVLDLSRSMLAEDISPNRLERAKREITDLIRMLEGDRIGIIPFAGVSYVSCPLTSDYRLAALFLNQLSIDQMPVQGTDIYGAVKRAAESLEKASGDGSEGKAIILITDGEESEDSLDQLVAYLKPKGIKVFSIGIGKEEGAPIPEVGGGFKKDVSGKVILSRLGETYLKKLSLATGGSYIRSNSGDMDLEFVYQNGIRDGVSSLEGEVKRQKIWHERYQIFALLSLLFLLPSFLVSDYRRKKRKEVSR